MPEEALSVAGAAHQFLEDNSAAAIDAAQAAVAMECSKQKAEESNGTRPSAKAAS